MVTGANIFCKTIPSSTFASRPMIIPPSSYAPKLTRYTSTN